MIIQIACIPPGILISNIYFIPIFILADLAIDNSAHGTVRTVINLKFIGVDEKPPEVAHHPPQGALSFAFYTDKKFLYRLTSDIFSKTL